jgi:hypothetical protein
VVAAWLHVFASVVESTRYWVTADPLSTAGNHTSVCWPLPGVAEVIVGAPGRPAGLTVFATVNAPVPAADTAATENEYAVPVVNPVMVAERPVAVLEPPAHEIA